MNTRPKLIQDGTCNCCSRDVSYCRCTVQDIHDWLEDQYMLPMTPVEFDAANPIPVVGSPGIAVDDDARDLGDTEVADLLVAIDADRDYLARDLVGGTLSGPG
jgi:hypothetical protein